MIQPVSVQPRPEYRIWIEFSDGSCRRDRPVGLGWTRRVRCMERARLLRRKYTSHPIEP